MTEVYDLDDSRHHVWGAVADAVPIQAVTTALAAPDPAWAVTELLGAAVHAALHAVGYSAENASAVLAANGGPQFGDMVTGLGVNSGRTTTGTFIAHRDDKVSEIRSADGLIRYVKSAQTVTRSD